MLNTPMSKICCPIALGSKEAIPTFVLFPGDFRHEEWPSDTQKVRVMKMLLD